MKFAVYESCKHSFPEAFPGTVQRKKMNMLDMLWNVSNDLENPALQKHYKIVINILMYLNKVQYSPGVFSPTRLPPRRGGYDKKD